MTRVAQRVLDVVNEKLANAHVNLARARQHKMYMPSYKSGGGKPIGALINELEEEAANWQEARQWVLDADHGC